MMSFVNYISETCKEAYNSFIEVPSYHLFLEGFMFMWVLWFLISKKKKVDGKIILTPEEEEQIIQAWKPKPLVEEKKYDSDYADDLSLPSTVWGKVEGRPGKYITVDGEQYLNLATHNYLGLVDDPSLDKEAERCIRKYGVGSCGPRGFYGSVDVHLELEEKIAKFLKFEETALYSYGFSTIASAIPSYAKAGDMIFADEQVNFSIQKGLQASRSIISYFKHNDIDDLQRLLDMQARIDKKNPKKAKTIRRFCVVEGIYNKTGEMCPLNEVAKLCKFHKVRLFVDESISFAAVGPTGRGVTEHLKVPLEDIDLVCGSLENGLGAFGGFIVGPSFVVDHQRISGLGYCFSASLPPLLAGVGIQSLKMIEENPKMITELQNNCKYMHRLLSDLSIFTVMGHELSPIKHICLSAIEGETTRQRRGEIKLLYDMIILEVKKRHNIALVQPYYLEKHEHKLPAPSIRIAVNRLLTKEDMDSIGTALDEACEALLEYFPDSESADDESSTLAERSGVDNAEENEELKMLLDKHQTTVANLQDAIRKRDAVKRQHASVVLEHETIVNNLEETVQDYENAIQQLEEAVLQMRGHAAN